jgi:hypothetical protein
MPIFSAEMGFKFLKSSIDSSCYPNHMSEILSTAKLVTSPAIKPLKTAKFFGGSWV